MSGKNKLFKGAVDFVRMRAAGRVDDTRLDGEGNPMARRVHLRHIACWLLAPGLLAVGLAPLNGSQAAPPASTTAQVSADACGPALTKNSGRKWRCTFADDFTGRSLDRNKWVVQDTARTGFHLSGACLTGDTNLKLRRGKAHMSVTREEPFVCKSPRGDFRTRFRGVDLSTHGRFAQTYGRFEARIAFPQATGKGVHGGFWMNPQERVYGKWPHSGEIDVAEYFSNRPGYVHPSLHYAGRDFWEDTGWKCHIGRSRVFRTYAVEWTPRVMRFYVDGQLCWRRSWTPDAPLVAPQPFDQDFYLSLTQGIGPKAFNAPSRRTQFPATMVVDYVRAWS